MRVTECLVWDIQQKGGTDISNYTDTYTDISNYSTCLKEGLSLLSHGVKSSSLPPFTFL